MGFGAGNELGLLYLLILEMACRNCNRWGPGTTCERPQNTAAVREMDDRMKAMLAERARVDALWSQPLSEGKPEPKAEAQPYDPRKNSKSAK